MYIALFIMDPSLATDSAVHTQLLDGKLCYRSKEFCPFPVALPAIACSLLSNCPHETSSSVQWLLQIAHHVQKCIFMTQCAAHVSGSVGQRK